MTEQMLFQRPGFVLVSLLCAGSSLEVQLYPSRVFLLCFLLQSAEGVLLGKLTPMRSLSALCRGFFFLDDVSVSSCSRMVQLFACVIGREDGFFLYQFSTCILGEEVISHLIALHCMRIECVTPLQAHDLFL